MGSFLFRALVARGLVRVPVPTEKPQVPRRRMLLERLEDRLLFDAGPVAPVDADAELAQAQAAQAAMAEADSIAEPADVRLIEPLNNMLDALADLTGQPPEAASSSATVDGSSTSALNSDPQADLLDSDELAEQLLTTVDELRSELQAATADVRDELLSSDVPTSSPSPLSEGTSLTDAQRNSIEQIVRDSTDQIWFERNVGQFADGVLYGFRTTFGATLVYADHLRLMANQADPVTGEVGQHIVDIQFTGSRANWSVVPGGASEVLGTYQQADGTALRPEIFNEVTLRNVYDGVDLRLYSAEKGMLEFDWIVARAQDYSQIRIAATGQDGIVFNDDGSATLDLRYQDLTLKIPESYQVIDGVKHLLDARMVAGDTAGEIRYSIADELIPDQPLVIDPNVAWSTYFDLNDGTTPFDSYTFAIAVNSNGVYVSGWTRETITNGSFGGYMQVNAGFSQGTATFQNYIYRMNTAGTTINAWTSTGILASNNTVSNQKLNGAGFDVMADLELFPDGRLLAGFNSGLLQIYSANLSTRAYSAEPVTLDSLNAVAIVDNNSFYASGRVAAAIPIAQIPAANIGPDATYRGGGLNLEGVIVRYSNASTTPTANWATYVGGDKDEYFTSIALTPDKTKLVFATSSVVGAAYPALVNAVDSTVAGTTELIVGVLPEQSTKPAAFSVFSHLGGSGNEGTLGTNTTVALVTANNSFFWVGGNTASVDLPGTAGGLQTANGGGAFDVFMTRIPLNGSAGAGFQSTYLGGSAEDNIGGMAYDTVKDKIFVYGTTAGSFPTKNTTPASNYFDNTLGGGLDIFLATTSSNLSTLDYSTYIGGSGNDYLGQTGDLIGQGHVYYSPQTDLSYLATTVHSADLPTSVIGTPPGKDISKSNAGNDSHIVLAFNINLYDYGDAPASYEAGTPAAEAISGVIRIGNTFDAEFGPASGTGALGDDNNNTGSPDDEDGIASLPTLNAENTSYSLNVSVFNNTGATTTLHGWIDFDLDGVFQADEYTSVAVPNNVAQQMAMLSWSGFTATTPGQSYLRLRLTDTAISDNAGTPGIDERSVFTGSTSRGEVEDSALTINPFPTLSVSNVNTTEGTDPFGIFTVSLSRVSSAAVSFGLALSNISALGAGTDYGTSGAGNLQVSTNGGASWADATSATIAAGQTSLLVRTPIVNDTLDENTETFSLTVTTTSANTANASATGTGTIVDNDPPPTISIDDVTVNEGAGTATFTVTLNTASGLSVTVDYATSNGTATAGSDYASTSGTKAFAAGVTSQTVTVSILNDTLFENSESFNVNLSNPTNATIADNLGIGTILDNGGGVGGTDNDTPTLSISNVSTTEGIDSFAVFTASLDKLSTTSVTFSLSLINGTASGTGVDFGTSGAGNLQVSTNGGASWSDAVSATIAAGQTSLLVRTPIVNDAVFESAEDFTLFTTVTAGTTTNGTASGTGTINNNPLPTAVDDSFTTSEDSPVSIAAKTNDSDPTGDPLTITQVNGSAIVAGGAAVAVTNGTVNLNAAGTLLTFTPSSDFNGPASFTYTITDGHGGTSTATISGSVTAVNDPPTASNNSVTTPEDTPFTFSAASFPFSDVDAGDTLQSVKITSLPSIGTLTLGGVPVTVNQVIPTASLSTLVFTPVLNGNGTPYTTFDFQVSDGTVFSSSATLTVNVTPVNDPPTTANSSVTTPEDTPVTFAAGNFPFSEVDAGDTLQSVKITSLPSVGTLTLGGVPVALNQVIPTASLTTLVFTPTLNANGSPYTTFGFQVSDGTLFSGSATMTVNVTPVNDPPTTANNSVTTPEDTPVAFSSGSFPFSEVDAGDTLQSVKITSLPSVGSLTLGGVAVSVNQVIPTASLGTLVFTPVANANGLPYTTFDFQVSDGTAFSGSATMTVNVTPVADPPTTSNNSVTTPEDTPFTFASGNFPFSDVDAGDTLQSVKITALPSVGSLTLGGVAVSVNQVIPVASLGTLVFTPVANANGSPYTTFNFQVSDGSAFSGSATMTINVTPVADPPTTSNNSVTTPEDTPFTFGGGSFPFSDVDAGDTLQSVKITVLPSAGSLTLGGVAVSVNQVIPTASLSTLVFTPVANANGSPYTTFNFQVSDGSGFSGSATMTINVTPVADPPTTSNNSVTTPEDTPFTFASGNFPFSDVDAGDALQSVKITALPSVGSLTLGGVAVSVNQVVPTASLSTLVFTPVANANGSPYTTFNFQVGDGSAFSGSATMTINVTPVADPPTTANNSVTTPEDTPFTFGGGNFPFSDVDAGDTLQSVKITSLPSAGSLTLGGVAVSVNQVIPTASLGTLVFSPALDANGTPYTTFNFQAGDGSAFSGSATMTINVTPVADPPTTANNSVTTPEDTPVTFVSGSFAFSDADVGDTLQSVKITALPSVGSLTLGGVAVALNQVIPTASLSTLVFTPAVNANGSPYTTFNFQVSDGSFFSGSATMTINVTPVADPPTTVNSSVTTPEDTPFAFGAGNFPFSDVDAGDTLQSVKILSLPSVGSLTLGGVAVTINQVIPTASLGTLVFAPVLNANGSPYTTFNFQVSDGSAFSGSATMTINVTPVADPPTTSNNSVTTPEDVPFTFASGSFPFSDVDAGDTLQSVRISALPSVGSLTLGGVAVTLNQEIPTASLNTLVFTPAANANGSPYTTFGFQVGDGSFFSGSATMTINVTPVADPPTTADNSVTTPEDTPIAFTSGSFPFSDVDAGDTLQSVKITSLPSVGSLTLGGVAVSVNQVIPTASLGTLVFTPVFDGNGSPYTTFNFQVSDGSAFSGSSTMTINVTPVVDPPTTSNNSVTTPEDAPFTFASGSFPFTDVDAGDTLQLVKITALPSVGSLTLGGVAVALNQSIPVASLGTLVFTPVANQNGSPYTTFNFQVSDGTFFSGSATMTINVTPVADPPTTANNSVTTPEDTPFTFASGSFPFSDVDVGDTLQSVKITTLPAAGSLTLGGVAVSVNQEIPTASLSTLVFTPVANANGSPYTTFNFQVSDGSTFSGSATMTINVTPVADPPTTANNSVTTPEDTPFTFASGSFPFSDVDAGDTLQLVKITSLPSVGTLTLGGVAVTLNQTIAAASLSTLVFTPVLNANGSPYTTFDFQVSDGIAFSGSATMTINVTPVADPPTTANNSVTTPEDTPFTFGGGSFPFSDVDAGDTLQSVKITSLPSVGSLTLGGVAVSVNQVIPTASLGTLVYTPVANANGSPYTTFNFQVSDGTSFSGSATMTVNVTPVADPPTTANHTVTTPEDTPFTFASGSFPFSDVDAGDTLQSVKVTSLPSVGSLTLGGVAVSVNQVIPTASLGTLVFTPVANANGSPYTTFNYQVSDGSSFSGSATMTVNVTPVADPPTTSNNSVTTPEDTPFTFASGSFPFSDVDAGDTLQSVKVTSLPSVGSLTLGGVAVSLNQVIPTASLNTLVFTPVANANGSPYTTFTFQVSDGSSFSGSATMTVNVTPVADPPTTANNSVTTPEDTPFTFASGSFPFSDVDAGDTLQSVKVTSLPSVGSLTLGGVAVSVNQVIPTASLGTLDFTPVLNGNGSPYTTFNFQVSDGTSFSGSATMTINVTPVNDAPTGGNHTVTTAEDTLFTFATTDFPFSDVDGDPLARVRIDTLPVDGTVLLNGVAVSAGQIISAANITAGNLKFSPDANENGSPYTTFTFSVGDASTFVASPSTQTVNVTPVNDAPTGGNQTVTTAEDTDFVFAVSDFPFSDVDGDPLARVRVNSLPAEGTLLLSGVAVTGGQIISAGNIAAGNLRFRPDSNETGSPYTTFTFSVGDASLFAAASNTMTVNVTPADDAPTGGNHTVTTAEDTDVTFGAIDFPFSDIDGEPLTRVRIDTLPVDGTVLLSGVAVSAGQVITVANITAGNLKFRPDANENGSPYSTFTFSVGDASAFVASPSTMTVNVTPVNDAPTGGNQAVTTAEDTLFTFAGGDFPFSDVDGDPLARVRINSLPADGTVLLSGVAVTAGQIISAANITAGNLKFRPDLNENGSPYTTFSFSVGDAISFVASPSTMTVNVTPVNDAPVARDNDYVTPEDVAIAGNVLTDNTGSGIDSDVDGDSLTVTTTPILDVSNGTLMLSADGSFTYTPDLNFNGVDRFIYEIRDPGGLTSTAEATISVGVVDDPPTSSDSSVTTPEDTDFVFAATDFPFSDVDGDPLAEVRIDTLPADGMLLLNSSPVLAGDVVDVSDIGSGLLVFRPDVDENGSPYTTFTFSVGDGLLFAVSSSTMTVNVTPVNDAPTSGDDTETTPEDTDYVFETADFPFMDADGDPLAEVRIESLPMNGTLLLGGVAVIPSDMISAADIGSGLLVFRPDADENGSPYTTFTFSVGDGLTFAAAPSTLTVNVTPVNDPPVADDETFLVDEDSSVIIPVLPGDTDLDGDTLSVTHIDGSAINVGSPVTIGTGIVSLNVDGTLTYTPNPNFNGPASFNYTVSDNNGGTDIGNVSGTVTSVNDSPLARDNDYAVIEDTPFVGNVLTDDTGAGVDSDIDGDSLTVTTTPVMDVSNGTLLLAADGSFTYTPNAGFNGMDSFVYEIRDPGGLSSIAVVTITVGPVNDAPTSSDQSVTTPEDTDFVFASTDFPFSDPDGTPLTFVRIDSLPADGTLLLNGVAVNSGDVIDVTDIDSGLLLFRPVANENGSPYSAFDFSVSDGLLFVASPSTMTVNVTPVNDAPTGGDDTETTPEDTDYVFNSSDFPFSDVDGDALAEVRIDSLPAEGTLLLNGSPVLAGDVVDVTDIDAGLLRFRPDANENGSPYTTFDFSVGDGFAFVASSSTMTMNVTPVNDPPIADDEFETTNEDTPIVIDVLDGDADLDGTIDPTSVIITSTPLGATLSPDGKTLTVPGEGVWSVNLLSGAITFTPEANYNGPVTTITYQVADDLGATDTADVSVTLTPVNDPPVADDESVTTNEDTPIVIDVVNGDTDLDGTVDPTSVVITSTPPGATLSADGKTLIVPGEGTWSVDLLSGEITFTPEANYDGPVTTITYEIADDLGANDTANVSVFLTPVNDPPVADDESVTTNEDTPIVIDVVIGDTDLDGTIDPTSVIITSTPPGATLSPDGKTLTVPGEGLWSVNLLSGEITFTPEANYDGPVTTITYQVADDLGATDTADVSVTLTPVNDPPVADDESVTTDEDTPIVIDVVNGDTDLDGTIDPTSVIITSTPPGAMLFPSGKLLVVPGEGMWSVNLLSGEITFTPEANYNGPVTTITYQVADDQGATDTANVSVLLTPVNDPPVADDENVTTDEDTPIVIDVVNGDTDFDGTIDPTSVIITSTPPGATVAPDGKTLTVPGEGLWSVNLLSGKITFAPEANYNGPVTTITYQVADDLGATDTANVSVTLTPVNDPPVADDESVTTNEDTPIVIDVVNGDTDLDGTIDPTSLIITSTPPGATLSPDGKTLTVPGEGVWSVNLLSGEITFTPEANYAGPVTTITYEVADNQGATDIANVSITLTPVNDPPIADDEIVTTNEDTPIVIDVVNGDTDLDGTIDPTSVIITSTPPGATLSPDGKTLTVPGEGGWSVDLLSGAITFTPEANDNGLVTTITYQVADDLGATDTANVSVSLSSVNDPPVADDESAMTNEDTPVVIDVVNGDTDLDGTIDPTSVIITSTPPGATLSPDGKTLTVPGEGIWSVDLLSGEITFTPEANYNGPVTTITYQVADDQGATDTANVSVFLSPVNDPPVADDESVTTNEGMPIVIDVVNGDTDLDGTIDPTTVIITSIPPGATLSPDGKTLTVPGEGVWSVDLLSGAITFAPEANYNGPVTTIIYQVSDNQGATDTANVSVTLAPINDPPVADDESVTTNEDLPILIDVVNGDTDLDGTIDPTSVIITSTPPGATLSPDAKTLIVPGEGVWSVDLLSGGITFTPEANYDGPVTTITYQVADDLGATDTANVSVTLTPVNDPPVADDESVTTNEDTPIPIDVVNGDTDLDGTIDPTSVIITSTPPGATLSPDGKTLTVPGEGVWSVDLLSGEITFTPEANYNGPATTITYQVADDLGATDTANVSVSLTPVNDPPVADDESVTTNEDTPVVIDVVNGDTDLDGTIDPTSVIITSTPPGATLSPDGKTLTVPGEGVWSVDLLSGAITFTPEANFNGPVATITYQVADDLGATDTANVSVTLTPVNDPPVADDESVTTNEDTPIVIDVVNGDTDLDGTVDPTSVIITSVPPGATLSPDGKTLTVPGEGVWSVDLLSGEITFTPEANYNGPVTTITYQVADDLGATDTANVSVTLTPVNDPPVADDESVTTNEDTPIVIDVVDGDTDLDGTIDPTSVIITSTPPGATLSPDGKMLTVPGEGVWSVDLLSGAITFTPAANYNGPVTTITYQVADDLGATDTASVSVALTPVNDAPQARDNNYSTPEDTAIAGNVLTDNTGAGVDTDLDGDSLTVTVVPIVDVTNGTLLLAADGSFTYTPNSGYVGADFFVYEIRDPGGLASTAVVTFSVGAVNDPPVGGDHSVTIAEDTDFVFSLSDFPFSDVDGDPLAEVRIDSLPTDGTLLIDGSPLSVNAVLSAAAISTGRLSFRPDANENGSPYTTFSFTVGDGLLFAIASNTQTINVTPTFVSVTKSLFDSTNPSTVGSNATIGEELSFALLVTMSEGYSTDLILTDLLPDGLQYDSWTLITSAVASNGLLTADFNGSIPAPSVSGGSVDGEDVSFTFGGIFIAADSDATNNSFLLLVNTHVSDIPSNHNPLLATPTLTNNVTADVSNPQPPVNSNPFDVTVIEPDLSVTIDNGVAALTAGQTTTYSITISNDGDLSATGIVLNGSLPIDRITFVSSDDTANFSIDGSGNFTWTPAVASLAPSSTLTLLLTVQVNTALAAGITDVTIPVSVTHDNLEPTPANNSAADTDSLAAEPDLRLTKTDFTNSISPGQCATYTLNVGNFGTQAATNVIVRETVPTGSAFYAVNSDPAWMNVGGNVYEYSILSLPAGASFNINFSVLIDNPAVAGQDDFVNTATINDDGTNGPDPDPTSNTATDTNTLDAVPMYDIGIDDLQLTATPGETLIYYVNFNNYGLQDGTGVVITVNFPTILLTNVVASNGGVVDLLGGTITWNVGTLPANNPLTYSITADVRTPVVSGANVLTLSTAITDDGANGPDPDLSDNSASDADTLNAQPDYSITIDDGETTVKSGDSLTYTINVANNGLQDGNGVVVTASFPTTMLENVIASNGGIVDAVAGTITWNLGDVASGASTTLTVNTQIRNNLSSQSPSITLTATVTDDGLNGPDPTPLNNLDSDLDNVPFYFFDGLHDWKDNRIAWLLPQSPTVGRPFAPLPVDPVFSGLTEPGSTLLARIYDADGRLLGDRQVVADSAGNWLISFPNIIIYQYPHRMEIIVTPAISNISHENGFNLRRYFHPAIHAGLVMTEPLSVASVFRNRAFNIIEAQHSANTYPLGFQWFSHAYELSAASSNVSQR